MTNQRPARTLRAMTTTELSSGKRHRARDLTTKPAGRPPSVYRPELGLEICEQAAEGSTLNTICASGGMPTPTTFRRWCLEHKELREAFQQARELKAHSLFDEALDLAREVKDNAKKAGKTYTSPQVRAFDLAMNQLRWAAAKLNPREYSDRSQLHWTVPIQINTTINLDGKADATEVVGTASYVVEARHAEEVPSATDGDLGGAPVGKRAGSGHKKKETER